MASYQDPRPAIALKSEPEKRLATLVKPAEKQVQAAPKKPATPTPKVIFTDWASI